MPNNLLQQQIEYYRVRSSEYDEWFLRQGRYDRGVELNRKWFSEIAVLREALDDFDPKGKVLEIACGTGLWTEHLLKYADSITAVDTSKEMIALNKKRLNSSRVNYIESSIFEWSPIETYDSIFFSFWLSHVPHSHFTEFWKLISKALKPDGRVVFIDSRYSESSTAVDHQLPEPDATIQTRRLNDGQEF